MVQLTSIIFILLLLPWLVIRRQHLQAPRKSWLNMWFLIMRWIRSWMPWQRPNFVSEWIPFKWVQASSHLMAFSLSVSLVTMMIDVAVLIFILSCIKCSYFAFRAPHIGWEYVLLSSFFYSLWKPSALELAFEVELDPFLQIYLRYHVPCFFSLHWVGSL